MRQLVMTNKNNVILLMQSFRTSNMEQSIYIRSVDCGVTFHPILFCSEESKWYVTIIFNYQYTNNINVSMLNIYFIVQKIPFLMISFLHFFVLLSQNFSQNYCQNI